MKRVYLFLIALVSLVPVSCERLSDAKREEEGSSDEIVFRVGGPAASASVETKATAVSATDLNAGFKVSCVKGSAGADTQVWSNRSFTKDGDVWKGGSWWPLTDESYRFYAVFPSTYTMTYAAGGPAIAASTTHDIVTAYASAPTYKSPNTLVFDHIFARVKNMTVTAIDGYTISGVTINITPKVSGTYNLYTGHGQTDGTGWSATSTGAAVNLANATPGTKLNDLYLVPGTYTLSASWTATKDNYTETFTNMTVDVALVAGKTNNISVNLTGNGTEIVLTVSVTDWSDNAVNGGTFPVVDLVEENSLSGEFTIDEGGTKVKFSKGNLWAHVASGPTDTYNYAADEWGFHTNQWDYCSQTLAVGNTVDHFGWVGESADWNTYGLCTNTESNNAYYGTSDSDALQTNWGDIPGVISACGSGWFTLDEAQFGYLFITRATGATVKGVPDARFTGASIRTDVSAVNGIILFPDGYAGGTPSGVTWGTVNPDGGSFNFNTTCTAAGWASLEVAGCVFLPASGERYGSSLYDVGGYGGYWARTAAGAAEACNLNFSPYVFSPQYGNNRRLGFAVRLVHGL